MTLDQILEQARGINPEVGCIHIEITKYADGDLFARYEANIPGYIFSGETPEELLSEILSESRKAA